MNAVARAIPRPARVALGPAPCALALGQAIEAIEDATLTRDALDAMVWRALGWSVERPRVAGRAGPWMCRSPIAASWQAMPRPSRAIDAAGLVVPFRWSWGAGVKNAHPHGWAALRLPMAPGVPFFECNGLTPALALLKAALHAQRWLAMRPSPGETA